MRKIYMMLVAALVVLAANSCTKDNMSGESVKPIVVRFAAQAADVKAEFNPSSYEDGAAVPVLWNGGENLSIAVGDTDPKDFLRNCSTITASDDRKSATWECDFSGMVTEEYAPSAPYTFHVFCGPVRAYHNGGQSKLLLTNIPSEQTPGADTCDPDAIYLYSKSGDYQTWPSEVEMDSFEHLTAYGCVTLGTGIPEDEKILSLTITADEETNLSGATWYFYKTGNKYANYTGDDSHKSSPSITLTPTEGTEELPRKNIWFGCRPTKTLHSDKTLASLKFTVTTDKGVYEVLKDNLGGRNFEAGKVAKMTIDGFDCIGITCEFAAPLLYDFIGGTYTTSETTKTATSGVSPFPSLNWNADATLIEGKASVTASKVSSNGVDRLKFNAGFDEFMLTLTPEEGWIVDSFTIYTKYANEKYNLQAKIGEVELLNKAIGNSDSSNYTRTNDSAVADALQFTFTRQESTDETKKGKGTFYINSLSITLKKQEIQAEETPEESVE